MMIDAILDIFKKTSQFSGCHQRNIRNLTNVYKETQLDDFVESFMYCLKVIFKSDIKIRNDYADRALRFAADFTVKLMDDMKRVEGDEEIDTHPFLAKILPSALKFHNLAMDSLRYYSSRFVMLVLNGMGDEEYLDSDLCDIIEGAMLERIVDHRPSIRVQAIMTLVRLQNPSDNNCPVIKAFLERFNDINPTVRYTVAMKLAANPLTLTALAQHVRDVDARVRNQVFLRFANLNPMSLSIENRQKILCTGFDEEQKFVRNSFIDVLIHRWLSCFEGNMLQFINATTLDADQHDIDTSNKLCNYLLQEFFRTHAIHDIIKCISLDTNKVIPYNQLNYEAVRFWNILQQYLKKQEELSDFLNDILPELTPFCAYLDGYIDKQTKTKSNVEEWQLLTFNNTVTELMDIAGSFDLADEVGRQRLHALIVDKLENCTLDPTVVEKMISILGKFYSEPKPIIDTVFTLINNIREQGMVEVGLTPHQMSELNFQLAVTGVKINEATEDLEDAVLVKNFKLAQEKKEELERLKARANEMKAQLEAPQREPVPDDKISVRCLDIFISLMRLPIIRRLDDTLHHFLDDFVNSRMKHRNEEIQCRTIKAISLCATHDARVAKENLQILCLQIVAYRHMSVYNKVSLVTTLKSVSDLMRLYGKTIFPDNGENTTRIANKSRRLYCQNETTPEFPDLQDITFELIVDIIVDMLNDDNYEIRVTSAHALAGLVLGDVVRSSGVLSRIIIKLFNPSRDKTDEIVRQLFSMVIVTYIAQTPNCEDIVENAILATLHTVAQAPKSSPLVDIDQDEMCRSLAMLTRFQNASGFRNMHKSLMYTLLNKLANKPQSSCAGIWVKLMTHLHLPKDDLTVLKELKEQAKLVIEDLQDKRIRKHLEKVLGAIISCINNHSLPCEPSQITEDCERTDATSCSQMTSDETNVPVEVNEPASKDPASPPVQNGGLEKSSSSNSADNEASRSPPLKKKKLMNGLKTPNGGIVSKRNVVIGDVVVVISTVPEQEESTHSRDTETQPVTYKTPNSRSNKRGKKDDTEVRTRLREKKRSSVRDEVATPQTERYPRRNRSRILQENIIKNKETEMLKVTGALTQTHKLSKSLNIIAKSTPRNTRTRAKKVSQSERKTRQLEKSTESRKPPKTPSLELSRSKRKRVQNSRDVSPEVTSSSDESALHTIVYDRDCIMEALSGSDDDDDDDEENVCEPTRRSVRLLRDATKCNSSRIENRSRPKSSTPHKPRKKRKCI